MSDIDRLREELATASLRAYARGIQTGNGGNVSARCPGEELMLVTASGGSFGDCTPDAFLLTDFSGKVVEGSGRPTRESLMHGRIYAARPDVGAVVHAHAPHAIAVAHTGPEIPRVTWHSRLKLGAPVPVLDVASATVRDEDWPTVAECLGAHPGLAAFVLRDHGIVALGVDPIEAEHTAELVEETAQVALLVEVLAGARAQS